MMKYRLEIALAVRDLIIHLPPQIKRKVKSALHDLVVNPYSAKALKDELKGLRSFRIGRSRMILRITGRLVEVVAFGPRKDIYERIATEVRKSAPPK